MKYICETMIGDEIRFAVSLLAKIGLCGLISKGPTLTLKGYNDRGRQGLNAIGKGIFLIER